MTDGTPAPDAGTETNEPDATTTAPTPEPPAAPPEAPATPWSEDLTRAFPDEAQRQQVDAWLRSTVQPYVTKLEQESAENRSANKLWQDFTESPVETYVAVTQELFGENVAQSITNVLRGDATPEDEETAAAVADEFGGLENLPPEVQEAVEFAQEQKRRTAYQEEMERVRSEHPDVKFKEELFAPFIAAADGDFDLAVEGYKGFLEDAKEEFGLKVPSPDDVPPPPPVVGSDTQTPAPTPVEQNFTDLDDALDAFFDEQKKPPPVVGAT